MERKHILFVDDSTIYQEVFTSFMGGYDFTFCSNSQEFFDVIFKREFDFIVLDFDIDNYNGIDLALHLRNSGSVNSHLPIIFFSAHGAWLKREIQKAQLDTFSILEKTPTNLMEMRNKIEKAIRKFPKKERPKRILAFDDDRADLDLISHYLNGHDLDLSNSPEDSLNFIYQKKYDLIILDYLTNCETNGVELATKIRLEGKNKETPILLYSSYLKSLKKWLKNTPLKNIKALPKGDGLELQKTVSKILKN